MTAHELLARALGHAAPDDRVDLSAWGRALDGACRGVTHDSRQVGPGWIFVALRGLKADGAAFAPQAVAAGAVAIVADRPAAAAPPGVPWIVVSDARLALAWLAAEFFGHPSRQMRVVGITGTNGKTTTAYLVSAIFEAAGVACGLLGTVTYRIGDRETAASRTTPEAPELQGMMRDMVGAGCGACAMEVSSHALALRRADGVRFAAGAFTNLTRDHLDFHANMEDYFAAKRRLFELLPPGAPAAINLDDPRGPAMAEACAAPVTYAISRAADVTPGPLAVTLDGLAFEVRTPRGAIAVRSTLVGRPNVSNILAAVTVATSLDVPLEAVARGLAGLRGVPGRFERVSSAKDDIAVIVDYAHTDDALRNLLETARPLAARRLITVFGAGGDRDRAKRPLMGMVAARLSDVVVITSDNPRSEDPRRIIDEVGLGVQPEARQRSVEVRTVVDRREAILHAVSEASAGDLVLIAGKGHEQYQELDGRTVPFDDVTVAREALDARRHRVRVG
ncbi:MAG: UDP-N-acetylmuramoyl-L-alanyl-D-glutamate--2,6-diaminopimelate ligase [Acidobacteria bacterium]|nr:UDP-N-acetylmuramoyl-L-alanyl-D-glutamate--2,6-diaminopimelate ligase [Acidobacteriota bacterium]